MIIDQTTNTQQLGTHTHTQLHNTIITYNNKQGAPPSARPTRVAMAISLILKKTHIRVMILHSGFGADLRKGGLKQNMDFDMTT